MKTTEYPEVVGPAEICVMLGITTKRLRDLRAGDFPPPAQELRMGPVWFKPVVEAWIEATADRRARHRVKSITPA